MRVIWVLTALIAVSWTVSAGAEYREHEPWPRFRPPEHHPIPPREGWREPIEPGHATVHHAVAKNDNQACDNADADPDAAIVACGRIISHGQTKGGYSLPVAYVHRGQAYQDKADFDHAIADFSDAIRLKPAMSGYFAMRGAAREKSGAVDGALSDFRQSANLDAANQEALSGIKRIETRSMAAPASAVASARPAGPASSSVPAPPPEAVVTTAADPHAAPVPPAALASAPVSPVVVASTAVAASAAVAASSAMPAPGIVAASASMPAPPPASAAQAGARVALVIGNGAYVNANALPNPPNDAKAIAGVLRQIGFDVQEGVNLNRADMESQFREFLHKATNASVVLFFYAGHGMQVDGKNYLVPVDAKLAQASDLPFETIEIDKLMEALGDPGHTNIILLDACRDNPLARSFASHLPAARSAAVGGGLAAYSAVGTGTLIAYATAPGQTALDGQGADSPFTTSLMHILPTPGLEIRQVLTRVRAEVAAATGNRQIPWDNSSLMGDVFLVSKEQ